MKARKIIRIVLIALLVLLLAAVICFVQFTPDGYRMTVPYRHAFTEIDPQLYVNRNTAMDTDAVISLVNEAKARDTAFYGNLQFTQDTIIIVCDDKKLLAKLSGEKDTCTYFFPTKQSYIIVSEEYFELDILAHEITHAELHSRLPEKALRSIPSWFDEGLAVQNDYREQYSEESWAEQTDNGKNATALEDMDTPAEFYAGEAEDRRFRYMCAKHEVSTWMAEHGQQGLQELLDKLKNGEDFHAAYGK